MKMLRIVAVGIVRESRKFSGLPCIGRIARSSLRCDSATFLYVLGRIVAENNRTNCNARSATMDCDYN